MKCLAIVIIAVLACVAADEKWTPPSDISNHEIHQMCVEESGVTNEQVVKIRRGVQPDEKEVREYILCSAKKHGLFTEDNGYHADRLMMILHADTEKAREIVTKCVDSNEQKSTPAVWAFRGVECLTNNKIGEIISEAEKRFQNNKTKEV